MEELMIKIDNISKRYRLGEIGGTTLHEELQRVRARRRHEEDPTSEIGSRSYAKGETFMALDGISFRVNKGERVGIIGHNGAGKSTLLKLISRVTAPTSGAIGLNGRVASMLEVGTGFHGDLTGRENIYMNGAILGMSKKEIDAKIEDIIDFSECRQFIDTPVKRYSSGMYVKLAFSVAAHLESEIMIMDEVLAVGDMAFQKKCLDKMKEVSSENNRTILYVSHNMNTIKRLCNRTIVLDKGKIIFDGDVNTGIDYYLNNADSNCRADIDCAKASHFRDGEDYITIENIHILDRSEPRCYEGEVLKARVSFFVKEPYKNVRFRYTIDDSEQESIGTSLSDCRNYDNKGRFCAVVSFDTTGLTVGDYYISVGMTTIKPEERKLNTIDLVVNAFRLTIDEREDTELLWSDSLGNWKPKKLMIQY